MNRLKSIKMKVGQKSSDSRLPKPPKPPEKPLMPYMRYSRKVWESVKNANGQLKLWEVGKIIGQMWRELPENEKSHFVEEYENDKLQYNDALRLYHNSPAYKSWLLHKEKVEKSMDENDSIDSLSQTQGFKQKDRIQKEQQTVETRESYILEDNDEDPEEVFTAKHVAAQRFQRNHKLMLDLFSDFKIPELGIVVTEVRLNALKQQVNGLVTHKRKLDDEMDESGKCHESKKLKIKTESEKFWTEYNKELEARPIITEKMFSDMVKKARDEIIREEKEREEFIKSRMNSNDKRMSVNDLPNENNLKSESVNADQIVKTEQAIENCISQSSPVAPVAPVPVSTVSKTPVSDTHIPTGPSDPVDSNPTVPEIPYVHMPPSRNTANYENRPPSGNYNYMQPSAPPNVTPNFQGRYPHSMTSGASVSKSNMHAAPGHTVGEQDQKYMKSSKIVDHVPPPNIEKEMGPDIKNKNFKEFSDLQFPPPRISESSPCPSNVSNNSKAPILSPECEPESKTNYYETNESSVSMQSPIRKVTSKKRKPPSKSKTASGSQSVEMDNMNPSQISPELMGSGPMANPHISPSKINNTAMDPGFQNDPNFSQLPMQQGMYPYHYYPPQFVPHGRAPAPYGSSYQPGFNQANYYNQMPQAAYRAMAPHPVQAESGVNQYGLQHKPMPHNQAYSVHPYGPGPYAGGYGSQFGSSNQSFPNSNSQPVQEAGMQIHTSKDQILSSQPNSIPSQMNIVDESSKYQNEVQSGVSGQNNPGFGNNPIGGPMPPPGYSSQYPCMPYLTPPVASGTHYSGVQGHFYYPPGPQSHSTPGPTPPDHPFWSHQQSSNYSSMQSLIENNSSESQPPKIQE